MKRVFTIAALIAVTFLRPSEPVQAQSADALGHARPVADLPDGTVTVRVVNGDMSKPYVGVDVALRAGDRTITARTDAEGRATFPNPPRGVELVAAVSTPEGDAVSDSFVAPTSGGLRFLLSPVPLTGPMAGATAAGAPAGAQMPRPRQMSGQPRPEQKNPVGVLTVRVVYDDLAQNAVGVNVVLVGYHGDDTVTALVRPTEQDGRARFEGLKILGHAAYYAMALVPRDDGVDRLISQPVMMPADSGVALMLSAEARGAKKPTLDEVDRYDAQQVAVAPGRLAVRLTGAIPENVQVELYDPVAGKVISTAAPSPWAPTADMVSGSVGKLVADPKLPDGALSVVVVYRAERSLVPLEGRVVRLLPATAPPPAGAKPAGEKAAGDKPASDEAASDKAADVPLTADHAASPTASPLPPGAFELTTSANGLVAFPGLAAGATYVVETAIHGKIITSEPLQVPAKAGARVDITVRWPDLAELEAVFDGLSETPDKALVAQVRANGFIQRAAPVQMLAGRGVGVLILVLPQRLYFTFNLAGMLDDAFMGFQGAISLYNWGYTPYETGVEGLLVPLPSGFTGASVGPEVENKVKVDPDRGLIWRGVVPPGNSAFQVGFSLKVHDGAVGFDLPLPIGTAGSSLTFVKIPGMKVDAPKSVSRKEGKNRRGQDLLTFSNIDIRSAARMVLRVTDLPAEPAWRHWVRWAVGGVVLALLLLAVVVAVVRRRGEGDVTVVDRDRRAELRRRRDELIEDIVRLEKRLKSGAIDGAAARKDRRRLEAEIERIYLELSHQGGAIDGGAAAG